MSTPEIITLAEAKAYLRVDHDGEDATIQTLIDAACEAAVDYADAWDAATDAPARLRLAVLGHVARAFDARDDVDVPAASQGLARPLRTIET